MCLPFDRGRRRRRRGIIAFSIIYPVDFMKFSGFVYHVEDYCCANFRNQQSFLTCLK